ncbi:MAG: dihydroorotate dehydrogenase-like protein [Ferrimicrobium sp.]
MNVSTTYMGIDLKNPIVASASSLTYTLDGVRRLSMGGVGAIVMHSLFEEELLADAEQRARLLEVGSESFAESLSYFPDPLPSKQATHYLRLLEQAVATAEVPVIASLNGATPGGWTAHAREIEDAGAAAIELNIHMVPVGPGIDGRRVEDLHVEILQQVKAAVRVPVAVKLSPFFSSVAEMASRLDEAGADAVVLFSRFPHPRIDPEALEVIPSVDLSNPVESRLPQTWVALLHGHLQAAIGASGGVEGVEDVVSYLLAGADVVMTTSALLRHGPAYAESLAEGLTRWMARKGFVALDQVRGLLAVSQGNDAATWQRAQYVDTLRVANANWQGPW